jgi:sugar/nucleoside kinase (ribokinase family)
VSAIRQDDSNGGAGPELGRSRGRDLDLIVVGEINPDIVVRAQDPRPVFGQVERWVDSIDLVVGSSAVIFACGAVRLGLRTAFVGLVGDDAFGRFMLSEMTARGIVPDAIQVRGDVPTGATVLLSAPGDRAILTAPGSIPLLRTEDVPRELFGRARHLHVGSVFMLDTLRPELAGLLAEARLAGLTTSIDTNWDPTEEWDGGLAAILAQADVFLPNAAEAMRISGQADPAAAALALVAAGPGIVAVKLGAEGGLAAAADGTLHRRPALPVTPIDTVGAGDSFDAGFLAGWLGGRSLPDALALAVACGSLSTLGLGGTAAQPTLAEADDAVRSMETAR